MLKSPEWHLLIVWYFFLGGIAGGAYFTAAIADNFGGPRDRNVVRTGYMLSLLMIGVCGMLLILDLGTPSRFMNMIGTFKFKDPMSIGAWMLGVFGLFSFVSSALSLVGGEERAGLRRRWSLVGILFGFFLASYTGVLLSATALPFWRDGRLMGALFLASGASTGMAAISLLLYLSGDRRGRASRRSSGRTASPSSSRWSSWRSSSSCSARRRPRSRRGTWPRSSGVAWSCSGWSSRSCSISSAACGCPRWFPRCWCSWAASSCATSSS